MVYFDHNPDEKFQYLGIFLWSMRIDMSANIFEELQWRGMVYDSTEGSQDLVSREKITLYNGFDATADSLHVGHLVPLIALARFQRFGHHPIAVAGGGTTMIGDPSGKASERQLLTRDQIEANVDAIKQQLAHFMDFDARENPARLVNNADWLLKLNFIEFMRDIGKHFSVNAMLAKESVRTRLEREEGLSFTEFSYMLLQSYDFLHLSDAEGCVMQTGGSDQWGNITAGADLIRRLRARPAYGMVYPLITKSDGTKFGKTETGTVWLSPERTSPYAFYQFWLNTDDRDVVNYLKYFTFLLEDQVRELETATHDRPEERSAQRTLAHEMTTIVHGQAALERAEQAAKVLFGGEIQGLSAADIAEIFADVPSSNLSSARFEGGISIVDLLAESGLSASKGEARRSIAEGGISVNNRRVSDPAEIIALSDAVEGRFIVLRKGRKNYHLVKLLR
jgi:tyrosyl-tRNA synthetase